LRLLQGRHRQVFQLNKKKRTGKKGKKAGKTKREEEEGGAWARDALISICLLRLQQGRHRQIQSEEQEEEM